MLLKNIWGINNNENFFRKKLVIKDCSHRAYARIFADTGYELFINGHFVATVDEWSNTRDYEVSKFLKEGDNIIAVHAFNHAGHRGFAFELATGGKSVLTSDGSWLTYPNECWGWQNFDFCDLNWKYASELNLSAAGEPQWWTLPGSEIDRIIPTLDCSQFFRGNIPKGCCSPYWNDKNIDYCHDERVLGLLGDEYKKYISSETFPDVCTEFAIMCANGVASEVPVKIESTERYTGPNFVIDFKCEVCGYFRMKIISKSPFSFRLHYGETINEVLSEPSRDVCQNRMLCEKYRVFDGKTEFESRLKTAFRYVRVEFYDSDSPITADGFSVRTKLYPVAKRGYFSCDDDAMNTVWKMGEKTLHLCMQEYYLDAPKRDRFLWTGDARLEALINYYTFADTDLFEFSWNELSRMQFPNGAIPASFGEGNSILWDYVAWYVIAFHDYLMYCGNKEFVIKHNENIYHAVDFLASHTNADGLIDVPENPLGKLWMVELNEYVGIDPYLNELYIRALKTAKTAADISDDCAKSIKYKNQAELAENSYKELFCNDILVKTFDTTGHTQIQYELAENELYCGRVDKMIERIRKCWCSMITSGSDCMHECTLLKGVHPRIDEIGAKNPQYSYCHGWTAAANILLPMGIAGVIPTDIGFKKAQIMPNFDVFKRFKCAVPTPYGEIALKFEKGILHYCIPDGIDAELVINGNRITIKGEGSKNVQHVR